MLRYATFPKGLLIVVAAVALLCACDTKNIGILDSPGGGAPEGPTITADVSADNPTPEQGDQVSLSVSATHPQGQALTYEWDDGNPAAGEFTGSGNTVVWTTDTPGVYTITVRVTDTDGNFTESSLELTVTEPGAIVVSTPPQPGYVGKETCQSCHNEVSAFNDHRHNHKLNPATSEFIGGWWTGSNDFGGVVMDFMANGVYSASIAGTEHQIVRALGWGVNKWKQRYIVQHGNSWYITPAQHNVVTDEWVNYHPENWDAATGLPSDPNTSYDRRCAGCHTTGTNVQFSDETGEWVMGFNEENVQCEACHGPGADHAGGPSSSNIVNPNDLADYDRQVEVCGACHGRGSSVAKLGGKNMGYPFSADGRDYVPGEVLADFYEQTPGLWPDGHSKKHHQQYNDFLLSEHYGTLTCWQCHDSHDPDPAFTNDLCTACHVDKAASDLAEHTQHATELQCIDCHMPFTAKSAIAYDVRSHAFDIIQPQTSLDNFLADPANVIPNSCMNGGCHSDLSLDSQADIEHMVDEYDELFGEGPPPPPPADATAFFVADATVYDTGDAAGWDAVSGTDFQMTGNPSTGGHGPVGSDLPVVNVKTVHDGTNFAMRFAWADASENATHNFWTNSAGDWSRGGNEDRMYVMWETGDPAAVGRMGQTFSQVGCAMTCHQRDGGGNSPILNTTAELFDCSLCHTDAPGATDAAFSHLDVGDTSCDTCHGDYSLNVDGADMISPAAGATFDVWHWKAGRSNPLGIAEDQWMPPALRRTRDESNLASSGNSFDSASVGGEIPLYVYTDDRPDGATAYIFQSALAGLLADDTLAMWDEENGGGPGYYLSDGTTAFVPADGATVPRAIHNDVDVDTDRSGNTKAHGVWADDSWVVVIYRVMAPGETDGADPTDKDFMPGETYSFGLAVTDNSGISHRGANLLSIDFEPSP